MENINAKTSMRLQQALERSGITQQELANRSGVAKASISQYIHGRFAPSNLSATKMAKVLKVSPAWLMGFDVPIIDFLNLTEQQLLKLYEFYLMLLQEEGK